MLPSTDQSFTLARDGKQPAHSVTLKMLIDTGADHTSVVEDEIVRFGLLPRSFVQTRSVGGVTQHRVYELSVRLGEIQAFDPIMITARSKTLFQGTPYQGLLGRDVLDRGLFIYNGASSQCTLAF
ncbi:MAG: retroviral-like aspartic protease family protein [Pseudomonadota bacterium]